jgi:hypothetical protein
VKRAFLLMAVVALALLFSACAKRQVAQQQPDLDKVRQEHQDSQQDLQNEEDKKSGDEEEE